MGETQFHWGVLGPGRIANQFAGGLRVIADAELYAVASHSIERARDFAQRYAGQKVYGRYEDLVNDPQVDAVYISTPHRFHAETIRLCLEAGKPVLCEKPLTVNAAEARPLFKLARDKRVFLMEALWTRYLPVYTQVRQWLDARAIGSLRLLVSTFGGVSPRDPKDRWLNPELAGGTLLDMGVYPIAISQWVMRQNPISFSAQAVIGATGVDELTAVVARYAGGVVAQYSSNFLCENANDFTIYGDRGSIRIHSPFWYASRATLATGDQELTVNRPLRGSGFEYEIEEAMRCIRQGMLESPRMTHADTLANLELMDQIRGQIGVRYPFED